MNKDLIAGVVILYNPGEEVMRNILSYSNQVKKLLVFDNTEGKTSFTIEKIKAIDNAIYFAENRNKGVAYALNFAANYALNSGYSYLLTMDQDSVAHDDFVEHLYSAFYERKNTGLSSPFFRNKYDTKSPPDEKFSELFSTMTSGNLLNLQIWKETGKFRDDYFIDYIDIEYCFRLRKNGYLITQVNSAMLEHNEANISRKRFLFRKVYPYNNAPIRFYYKTRNYFHFRREYSGLLSYEMKIESKFFVKNIIKMLVYEKERVHKIRMIFRGYFDFRKNISGRFES
ncbi:MAG: glycosyltransferase [Ignavibacteriaceae bacterium]